MPEASTPTTLAAFAQTFQRFAEEECRGYSPLYEQLAMGLAADAELLRLAAQAPPGQPVPNLLLGAVHYLLYQQPATPLASYYPSLTATPQPIQEAYPAFRDFCLARQAEIVDIMRTRRVQTNEVRRCACLMPAFSRVAALAGNLPLALVEIGTSAGLNLLWDHYRYAYETGERVGDPSAAVEIRSTFRGAKRPQLPTTLPTVQTRIGIDLNVIDVRTLADTLWLKALIWPEHHERAALLTQALAVVQKQPPTLLTGDGVARLPTILAQLPAATTACIFHTYTLNQIPVEARLHLTNLLTQFSQQRPIYRVSCEWIGTPGPQLTLQQYHLGEQTETVLANCDAHARWIEWLDERIK